MAQLVELISSTHLPVSICYITDYLEEEKQKGLFQLIDGYVRVRFLERESHVGGQERLKCLCSLSGPQNSGPS